MLIKVNLKRFLHLFADFLKMSLFYPLKDVHVCLFIFFIFLSIYFYQEPLLFQVRNSQEKREWGKAEDLMIIMKIHHMFSIKLLQQPKTRSLNSVAERVLHQLQ